MSDFDVETGRGENFWAGLGKSSIDFQFALGELIDNSISACPEDEAFLIEINIIKDGTDLKLEVGDNSSGMKREDLKNTVMKPGGRVGEGDLNEHGFGFKNAMTVFTQTDMPFLFYTATEELDDSKVLKVEGTFPDLEGFTEDREEWDGNFTELRDNRGTRIFFKTSFDYFSTVYERGQIFETLISALIEHIGVIYKGYLSERKHNQIFIKWKDLGNDTPEWTEIEAFPIEPPYLEQKVNKKIRFEEGGEECECEFVLGRIDESGNDILKEDPIEVKRRNYYKGTTGTAGVNIIQAGRVLIPHNFDLLWDSPTRHAEVRKWIGELYLDPSISTVHTKNNVNIHDEKWKKLRDKLDVEEHKPIREGGPTESTIRERIVSAIQAGSSDMNANTYPKQNFWRGVEVDIIKCWNDDGSDADLDNADNYVLYEVKRGKSQPLDLYQLLMYWDALTADRKTPNEGVLIAKDHTSNVESIKDYLNNQTDSEGDDYNFSLKKQEDFNV